MKIINKLINDYLVVLIPHRGQFWIKLELEMFFRRSESWSTLRIKLVLNEVSAKEILAKILIHYIR